MFPGSFYTNPSSLYKEQQTKINLDELYTTKHEKEKQKITIFKKILTRIHNKIKFTSRQKHNDHFLFFVVPEFILGLPRYNLDECIGYIINELEDNGFNIKYTHPNLLFISWQHYIPSYHREMIKKETGVVVDGFGNVLHKENSSKKPTNEIVVEKNVFNIKSNKKQDEGEFKSIDTYKPSGIYNVELLKKIHNKVN